MKSRGFETKIPVFDGAAATVRQANQDVLSQCDAVLLFYGTGDEAWKRTAEGGLKKMNGYRREKPLLASYTYLSEPATVDKEELIELDEPNLINGLQAFSESHMKPFLQELQAA